jgi:hypothetical protein
MFQERYTIYIRQKAHYFPYIIQHNILFVSGLFLTKGEVTLTVKITSLTSYPPDMHDVL